MLGDFLCFGLSGAFMERVKVGDVVVVVEAHPPKHNGEIGTVYVVFKNGEVLINLHSAGYSWNCIKVRPATLLEKELAEL